MLSNSAEQLIQDYLNLPFPGASGVRCPYFNNARFSRRAQLRVLVGKGTPKDIVEEAKIISIQYHSGLFDRAGHCCLHGEHVTGDDAAEEIEKFLVDNGLGIDCSGFVSHVLRRHFKEKENVNIFSELHLSPPGKFVRWLITRFRPAENISVKTFIDDRNTVKISGLGDIKPADLIVMLETGPNSKRDHILLVTENDGQTIKYVHARAWTSEGLYGHGVARGKINIIKPNGNLLEQEWVEFGKTGEQNATFLEAKNAKLMEIRRLRFNFKAQISNVKSNPNDKFQI